MGGQRLHAALQYKLQIDVAGGGGDILRDMELEYELVDDGWLTIKGGQLKTPYCRQEMTSSVEQEFVDRSLACNNFRFERARGRRSSTARRWNSLIEYYAGAFNTTGRNGPSNPDTNFLYVDAPRDQPARPGRLLRERLRTRPSPLFGIGSSYGYEKRDAASVFTTAATTGPNPDDPDDERHHVDRPGAEQRAVPAHDPAVLQQAGEPERRSRPTSSNLETDLAFRWMGLVLSFEYFLGFVANSAHAGAAPSAPFELPPSELRQPGLLRAGRLLHHPEEAASSALRYSEFTPNDDVDVTKPERQTDHAGPDRAARCRELLLLRSTT